MLQRSVAYKDTFHNVALYLWTLGVDKQSKAHNPEAEC